MPVTSSTWVQRGEMPADFRPMPDVGPGVMEIRVHAENEFRVFYVARLPEAVYGSTVSLRRREAPRKRISNWANGAMQRCWN